MNETRMSTLSLMFLSVRFHAVSSPFHRLRGKGEFSFSRSFIAAFSLGHVRFTFHAYRDEI